MERRNRSLKALAALQYLDSLDDTLRADALVRWVGEYLTDKSIGDFDLEYGQLQTLSELFYKNITFLKDHTDSIKSELEFNSKVQKFLQ